VPLNGVYPALSIKLGFKFTAILSLQRIYKVNASPIFEITKRISTKFGIRCNALKVVG
jgi:hypothetical protein